MCVCWWWGLCHRYVITWCPGTGQGNNGKQLPIKQDYIVRICNWNKSRQALWKPPNLQFLSRLPTGLLVSLLFLLRLNMTGWSQDSNGTVGCYRDEWRAEDTGEQCVFVEEKSLCTLPNAPSPGRSPILFTSFIREWSGAVPDSSSTLFAHSQWTTGKILFFKKGQTVFTLRYNKWCGG